jgi:hypothetical protein
MRLVDVCALEEVMRLVEVCGFSATHCLPRFVINRFRVQGLGFNLVVNTQVQHSQVSVAGYHIDHSLEPPVPEQTCFKRKDGSV